MVVPIVAFARPVADWTDATLGRRAPPPLHRSRPDRGDRGRGRVAQGQPRAGGPGHRARPGPDRPLLHRSAPAGLGRGGRAGELGHLDHLLPVDVVRDLAAGSVRGALGGRRTADPASGEQGRLGSGGVRRPADRPSAPAARPRRRPPPTKAAPRARRPPRRSTPRWPRSRRSSRTAASTEPWRARTRGSDAAASGPTAADASAFRRRLRSSTASVAYAPSLFWMPISIRWSRSAATSTGRSVGMRSTWAQASPGRMTTRWIRDHA